MLHLLAALDLARYWYMLPGEGLPHKTSINPEGHKTLGPIHVGCRVRGAAVRQTSLSPSKTSVLQIQLTVPCSLQEWPVGVEHRWRLQL
jgi:hypothetical protein